jgi:phage-related protein
MADANLQVKITAEDAFSGVFSAFSGSLSGITSAATAPVRALGGIVDAVGKIGLAVNGFKEIASGLASTFGGPINAASDLNESLNKSSVVFGAAAGAVEDFSKTAATALGMSQQKALEATGSFGNLFVSMGLGAAPASDMSMNLVALAGDLASFNNIKPEEALEKLRSGIVGEAEPLRALGVNLSAAAIETQALAETHKSSAKELTAAEKATATYSLILKQTATAQGDFANTSSGLANSQRIIKAEFEDLQAKLGSGFLPVIGKVTAFLAKEMPDAFGAVEGAIGPVVEVLDGVVQEVLTFIKTVQNISRDNGLDVFSSILTALELRIGEVFGPANQSLFHQFVDVLSVLGEAGKRVFDALGIIFAKVLEDFSGQMDTVTLRQIALSDAMDQFASVVETAGKNFLEFANWMTGSTPGAEAFRAVLVGVIAGFIAFQTLQTVIGITQGITAAWTILNAVMVANPIGLIIVGIAALAAGLAYAYTHSETFRNIVDSTWATLKSAVSTTITFVVDTFNGFVTYMAALPQRVMDFATGIGTALVDGIVVGINSFTAKVRGTVEDLANSLPGWVKKILGIASPSTVFAEIGADIVDGLAQGIEDTTGVAEAATTSLADAIGAAMPVILSASETAVNKYNASIASALEQHARAVEDAERNHQQALADLQADYDKAKPADKAKVLQRIEDENVKYQRRLEDLELASARKTEDIATQHGDAMASIAQREAEQRGQALQNLVSGMVDVETSTASALEAVGERTGQRINDAISSAASAIADASARASEQIATAEASMSLSREIRGRRAEFSAGQTAAADERKAAQDASDLIRKRTREDSDVQSKFATDLAAAKTDVERKAITDRFNLAMADTQRKRQREDDDLAFRRQREADDRSFRQGQQAAAQAFSDQLENEALTRQIERINTERDNRITGINDALTAKQESIAEDAKREVENIIATSAQRISKLKTEFFDKVGPLTEEARGAIEAYIANVSGRIGALHAAATAAAAAVASVGGGGGSSAASNNVSGTLGTLLTTIGSSVGTIGNSTIEQGRGRGGYAAGGMSVPGGFAIVGERGPELVRLPGGADVIPSSTSMRMLGGGSDDGRPVIIQLDGQVIARTTWSYLKRQNLVGSNLGFA